MSLNLHANQYDNAFKPRTLGNWEVPKAGSHQGKHPRRYGNHTVIVANDRGHLLHRASKSRASPWGSFVGTWDLPNKLPGNRALHPTARSATDLVKYEHDVNQRREVMSGARKFRRRVSTPQPVKMSSCEDSPRRRPVAGMVCAPRQNRNSSWVGSSSSFTSNPRPSKEQYFGQGGDHPPRTIPCSARERYRDDKNQPRAMSCKISKDIHVNKIWPRPKVRQCWTDNVPANVIPANNVSDNHSEYYKPLVIPKDVLDKVVINSRAAPRLSQPARGCSRYDATRGTSLTI